mgnify:FL=1
MPYINVCIRNPVYRTRDLAARASVSLISEHCLPAQLNKNFDRIAERTIKDTECHGLLLQVRLVGFGLEVVTWCFRFYIFFILRR